MNETGERCQNCGGPAIGHVNELPFCEKEPCIEAVIQTVFKPIAEGYARAQARASMPVAVAR